MGNNPVTHGDPTGGVDEVIDHFVFNEKGQFVKIDENELPDRLVVENSISKAKQFYNFADPVHDPSDIRKGIINSLAFVSTDRIKSILRSQGAFSIFAGAKFPYESLGGGAFDYSYSVIPHEFNASTDPLTTPSNMLFYLKATNMFIII